MACTVVDVGFAIMCFLDNTLAGVISAVGCACVVGSFWPQLRHPHKHMDISMRLFVFGVGLGLASVVLTVSGP